jgi:hypothetical protein
MIRIAIAVLLLALTGCVKAMPEHDENNLVMNKSWHGDAPRPWPPMPFE